MISLALVCSFSRMRFLLGLGAVKQEEVREETLAAVGEALKKSSFLKVSEDGMVCFTGKKFYKMGSSFLFFRMYGKLGFLLSLKMIICRRKPF